MNADGSNSHRLTNAPGSDFDPEWSSGGSRIAFASDRDGNSEIYTVNPDGSGLWRLTIDPRFDLFAPTWSPDGSQIAFESRVHGSDDNSDIYIMLADGSGLTRLTDDPGDDRIPVWSPVGVPARPSAIQLDINSCPPRLRESVNGPEEACPCRGPMIGSSSTAGSSIGSPCRTRAPLPRRSKGCRL
jgi:hypothetical protein